MRWYSSKVRLVVLMEKQGSTSKPSPIAPLPIVFAELRIAIAVAMLLQEKLKFP